MLSPLTDEQLDHLDPDVKEVLQKYFNDQSSLESELKTKYERLRVDSGEPACNIPRIALSAKRNPPNIIRILFICLFIVTVMLKQKD
jgi:hypothetical protein